MIKVIFSKQAFKVYSGFLVNISAALFLSVPLSHSFGELTWRVLLTIISLGFAITSERKVK